MQLPDYNHVNPNLPDNDVILAAVGYKYKEIISALNNLGVNTFSVSQNAKLPSYLDGHVDLSLMHYSENELLFDNGISVGDLEQFFHYKSIGEISGKDYPYDCLLNSVRIGNNLICNEKYISKDILNAAYRDGLNIINVRQGYSKCSVCVLNESAIITDDISIYKSAQFFLNDILLIEKGSIGLQGANYGFIGGCTGKLEKNKIAFTGRVESHDNHNEIIDILNKYKLSAIELTNKRLYDIGSIIPLLEKKQ